MGQVIYYTVQYNHFREPNPTTEHCVVDREDLRTCECVLHLPDSYSDSGEETPLILSCHGSGATVCRETEKNGGVNYARTCIEAGYAVMDVAGAAPDGKTMGCPEHIFALYQGYRYAIRHYNLSRELLVAGASMGGHVALNFANMFPSLVKALGLFYPRLNMDSVTIDGHVCRGTWDKTTPGANGISTRDRLREVYRFPGDQWCEENTIGFNPYRTRAFLNQEGERVVIPPCPMKIWQGMSDTIVDPVMVQEYVHSVRRSGSYIELRMLEGVQHKISDVMREELVLWFDRFR